MARDLLTSAFQRIAKECQDRASDSRNSASKQLRSAVWLTFGGLILLPSFSWIIVASDHFASEMFLATPTQDEIRTTIESHRKRVESAKQSLTETEGDLLLMRESRLEELGDEVHAALQNAVGSFLTHPLARWSRRGGEREEDLIRDILYFPNGDLIVIGYKSVGKAQPIILRFPSQKNTEGLLVNETIVDESPDLEGRLFSATLSQNGIPYAVGYVGDSSETAEPLILRGEKKGDRYAWKSVELQLEKQWSNYTGKLYSVTTTTEGELIAVGHRKSLQNGESTVRPVALSSSDGVSWDHMEMDSPGEPEGYFYSSVQTQNSGLIVVGRTRDRQSLVVRINFDGSTKIFPPNMEESLLASVTEDNRGMLYAAGWKIIEDKDAGRIRNMLLLKSKDGSEWEEVDIATSTEGAFFDVTVASTGDVLAVGREGSREEAKPVVLRYVAESGATEFIRLGDFEGNGISGTLYVFSEGPEEEMVTGGHGLWRASTRTEVKEDGDVWKTNLTEQEGYGAGIRSEYADQAEELLNEIFNEQYVYSKEITDLREIVLQALQRLREGLTQLEFLKGDYHENENEYSEKARELDTITGLAEDLRKSKIRADEIRTIGRISIQFAVVGLLFYLIRMFVSRYRYFRDAEHIYEGRAQALELISSSPSRARAALGEARLVEVIETFSRGIGSDVRSRAADKKTLELIREAFRDAKDYS